MLRLFEAATREFFMRNQNVRHLYSDMTHARPQKLLLAETSDFRFNGAIWPGWEASAICMAVDVTLRQGSAKRHCGGGERSFVLRGKHACAGS